jgi:hypothetical protein
MFERAGLALSSSISLALLTNAGNAIINVLAEQPSRERIYHE